MTAMQQVTEVQTFCNSLYVLIPAPNLHASQMLAELNHTSIPVNHYQQCVIIGSTSDFMHALRPLTYKIAPLAPHASPSK
jgi:hypothetical protein